MNWEDYKKIEKLVNEKTEELRKLNNEKSKIVKDLSNIKTKKKVILRYISYNDYAYDFENDYFSDIKDILIQKIQEKIDKVSKEIQEVEIFIYNTKLLLK